MPIQHTFFGRPVRLSMPPRRFQVLFAFVFIFILTTFVYGPPTADDIPTYDQVKDVVKHPAEHLPTVDDVKENLPKLPKPFAPSAHQPPAQPNSNSTSQYGLIKWIYDFKWRNPFSSDVALDENTAVLPPLLDRPFVYTYYEAPAKQSKEAAEAENRLVLAWRRAWWAQGFKPLVLGRVDAEKHPQYDLFQRLRLAKVDPEVETEVMRWLAWGRMGGGLLTNWLAVPMAEYDNPMLSFLRKGEYPYLARVETLQDGVFFGNNDAVESALKKALQSPLFKNATVVTKNHDKIAALKKDAGAMVNLLAKDDITIEKKSDGIAYYSAPTISYHWKSLAPKLTNSTSTEGLDLLAQLINSHLHLTFQETYPEGIAVVKPLPEHTTALMYESIDIARNLTQCPTSPIPKSCPPNRTKCKPCNYKKPMKISLLPSIKNSTKLFTLGTTPHPYTLNLLHYMKDSVSAEWLRKNADRDLWISALTKDIPSLSGSAPSKEKEDNRDEDAQHQPGQSQGPINTGASLVYLKDTVSDPHPRSVFLTAERVSQTDIDWIFGFLLPQQASADDKPDSPSPESDTVFFPRPTAPEQVEGVEVPEERWLKNEEARLKKAREAIKAEGKHWKGVISAVEQWNLADTEAWRFARAFSARRRQERKKWEDEEKRYAGSEKKAGLHGGGGRWIDRFI